MNKRTLVIFFLMAMLATLISCGKKEDSAVSASKDGYKGNNYKIGVILPLTGKYSLYGESTLHGIECALGVFKPCEGIIGGELIIKDDKGDPEEAARAVEELLAKDRVSVIIGPLSSSSIDSAAAKAQELKIPLISLSQKEGVTRTGDYVFSTALTAALQVGEVVNYAINKKNLKTFAILYPSNPYGQLYHDLFVEKVRAENGRIVLSERYGESTTDFAGFFKKTETKFDAIFIPDSYRAVGFIASVMSQEGLENIQMLGINRWNNKSLVDNSGDLMQGAVFVDGFFQDNQDRETQRFVSAFDQVYGMKPTILEAQAYDAAVLAEKALQTTGGAHPADVRNSLAGSPEVTGATGDVSFDSNREAIKHLFLLTVKEDRIVELEKASSAPKTGKYGESIEKPASEPARTDTQKY